MQDERSTKGSKKTRGGGVGGGDKREPLLLREDKGLKQDGGGQGIILLSR